MEKKIIRLRPGCLVTLLILSLLGAFVYLSDQTCKFTSPINRFILDMCGYDRDEVSYLNLEEAIETGLPLYLPSSTFIDSNNLNDKPVIALKKYDSTCSYLQIDFYTQIPDNRRLYRVYISNGCVFSARRPSQFRSLKVDWVKNQEVFVNASEDGSHLQFLEPRIGFTYIVFSSEPLPKVIEFIESFSYVESGQ